MGASVLFWRPTDVEGFERRFGHCAGMPRAKAPTIPVW